MRYCFTTEKIDDFESREPRLVPDIVSTQELLTMSMHMQSSKWMYEQFNDS